MELKTTIEFFEETQAYIREKKCSDAIEAFALNLLSERYFAEAIEALKKAEKHRWHDLRKDPKDLPKSEAEVSVMAKMKCAWDGKFRLFEIRMTYSGKILCTGDVKGWGVSYPYDFDFETDEVIAWREIEPFEEDEA